MSEITPQDLRKKLVQLFVYAQNPDEKLMHLHGVEEDILAAFDAMAEKAAKYEALRRFLEVGDRKIFIGGNANTSFIGNGPPSWRDAISFRKHKTLAEAIMAVPESPS